MIGFSLFYGEKEIRLNFVNLWVYFRMKFRGGERWYINLRLRCFLEKVVNRLYFSIRSFGIVSFWVVFMKKVSYRLIFKSLFIILFLGFFMV